MSSDQRIRLRKEIADSLADLEMQWGSEDAALSKSRVNKILSSYPRHWPNIDEIIQCSNLISFYIENIIGRAKTALEVLDNANTTQKPPANNQPLTDTEQPETTTYKTFADLFVNPADIDVCRDALNKYEEGKNRQGRFKKFVLVAWIDRLHAVGKIRANQHNLVAPVLKAELGETFARRTLYDSAKGYNSANVYFTMHIPH